MRSGANAGWARRALVPAFALVIVVALAPGRALAHDGGCSGSAGSGDSGSSQDGEEGACPGPTSTQNTASPQSAQPTAQRQAASAPTPSGGPGPLPTAARAGPAVQLTPDRHATAPASGSMAISSAPVSPMRRLSAPAGEEILTRQPAAAAPNPAIPFDPGDTRRRSSDELPVTLALSGVAVVTSLVGAGFRARSELRRVT
ncbi:MAG TPA: hypothetical protein VKI64_10770 [Acidimicrobiales bacterium]|nr:hypothetical protein [Acidimicrobiales bacterium]